MTVSMNKVLAAVYASENAAELVAFTRGLLDQIDGNPALSAPVPSLAKVRKAVDALEEADVASQSRTRGTNQVRNEARLPHLSVTDAERWIRKERQSPRAGLARLAIGRRCGVAELIAGSAARRTQASQVALAVDAVARLAHPSAADRDAARRAVASNDGARFVLRAAVDGVARRVFEELTAVPRADRHAHGHEDRICPDLGLDVAKLRRRALVVTRAAVVLTDAAADALVARRAIGRLLAAHAVQRRAQIGRAHV